MSILAIGWEPELRGIVSLLAMVFVLCGGVYLILGTNVGARLGFLLSFSALAGWMAVMGAIWWAYGIGLQGPLPTWEAVSGRTVLQDVTALNQSGAVDGVITVDPEANPVEQGLAIEEQLIGAGWTEVAESDATFGQAGASASVFIEESGAFAAGEYRVANVFDIGGRRYPNFFDGRFDYFAFFHEPRFALVQVEPLVTQRTEPGRAPAPPQVDETRPSQYVYMVRDLGARRQPAAFITIGSTILFLISCWLLHRRDKRVMINRGQLALPAKA